MPQGTIQESLLGVESFGSGTIFQSGGNQDFTNGQILPNINYNKKKNSQKNHIKHIDGFQNNYSGQGSTHISHFANPQGGRGASRYHQNMKLALKISQLNVFKKASPPSDIHPLSSLMISEQLIM